MVDHLSYYSFFFFYFSCIIFIFSFLVIHPWVVLPRDSWGFVLKTFGVRLVYEVPHAFFGCYARLAPLLSLGWIWYCALCTLINHTGCFWEDRWESGGKGTEVSYFDSFFLFLCHLRSYLLLYYYTGTYCCVCRGIILFYHRRLIFFGKFPSFLRRGGVVTVQFCHYNLCKILASFNLKLFCIYSLY